MFKAVEICTTGWCPFNCSYCYIPKSPEMKRLHEKIRERIKDIEFWRKVAQLGDFEHLGFWGTEPTLTLNDIPIEEVVKLFPRLRNIAFSTSLMYKPEEIVKFAERLPRRINLDVQISLDGPSWITDVNRIPGAAKRIPENFRTLIIELNESETCPVRLKWKATHDLRVFKEMTVERAIEYREFFESLNTEFRALNKRRDVRLLEKSYYPTAVVPGKYTSEDGRIFARYLRTLHASSVPSSYDARLAVLYRRLKEPWKARVFTCSGADSNFGFDGQIHICHRTFYYNDEAYVNSVLEMPRYKNWDVSLFERGVLSHIQRWYICDFDDLTRFQYMMRGYHDFWRLKIGYTATMTRMLAKIGQAEERFLSDEAYLETFCLYLNSALSCPMENLLNTGTPHLQVVSLIRLFGNGAFSEVIEWNMKRRTVNL